MVAIRALVVSALLLLAAVLQVSLFPPLAVHGVVPNLVLLVVVAAALTRGPEVAGVLGLVGGLVLDLTPPADHVAGRWALALVVVAFLAGRVRQDAARSAVGALAVVAASSFVGTSVFALSGMVLADPAVPATRALPVVGVAVLYDVALAPFVLPPAIRLFRSLRPRQAALA